MSNSKAFVYHDFRGNIDLVPVGDEGGSRTIPLLGRDRHNVEVKSPGNLFSEGLPRSATLSPVPLSGKRLFFERVLHPSGSAPTLRYSYASVPFVKGLNHFTNGLLVTMILSVLAQLAIYLRRRKRRWSPGWLGLTVAATGGLIATVVSLPMASPSLWVALAVSLALSVALLAIWVLHWGWTVGRELVLDMVLGPFEDEDEDEDEDAF